MGTGFRPGGACSPPHLTRFRWRGASARGRGGLLLSSCGTSGLMGKGREIGAQLHAWLARGDREALQSRRLEGVLLDALGGDPRLRAPVRDLALQPLLLKLLQEPSPAARRSMLETLVQDLQATYAPAVLAELLDLLVEPIEQQYLVDVAAARCKRSIAFARAFGEAWCT